MRRLRNRPNLVVGVILLLAPLLWFAPVVIGGKTLLPADNLYQFQPWTSLAEQMGATTPHNELLSDLVLENLVWKTFLRETLAQGELPLWNPYIFSGVPSLPPGSTQRSIRCRWFSTSCRCRWLTGYSPGCSSR